MKKIRSSISLKLTIPVVLIVGFLVVLTLVLKWNSLNKYQFSSATISANSIFRLLNNEVESASEKALLASTFCATLPIVERSYENYYLTKNFEKSSDLLKSDISALLEKVYKITGGAPKIHFHIPPARSFLRSWSEERGDELNSYRKTILEINDFHKPIKGIETDRTGFSIRGISPIINNAGEYLGSVEIQFPYSQILQNVINNKTEDFAIFIKKNQLETASQLNQRFSDLENNKIEKYKIIESSANYRSEFLENEDFELEKNKIEYKSIDQFVYALTPIIDFSGKEIGVVAIQIDITEFIDIKKSEFIKNLFLGIGILIVVSLLLIRLISKIISQPVKNIANVMDEIASGKLVDEFEINSTDEIARIHNALNNLLKRLKISANFANEIGKGNLEVELDDISEDDVLSHSLIRMRNNIQEAKNLEILNKIEEEKRSWSSQGITQFADKIRNNKSDIEHLAKDLIKTIVEYIDANQGGLFIINENDKDDITLDLLSAVAFEREKFLKKSIKFGEGLVGVCAAEKETVNLKEVPEDYINITSGLGGANPKNILLVPLKLESDIYGVIEIASFKEIEDYKVVFVEKVGEMIASSLSALKINAKTAMLLEQSQQQSEELAAQEEEMRQNLEEMQATQESLETEMQKANKAVFNADHVETPIINIDNDFNVTYINKIGAQWSGVSVIDALNKKCYELFDTPHCRTSECRVEQAMNSKKKCEGITTTKGIDIFYSGTPILNQDGNVIGGIEQMIDISRFKKSNDKIS